MSIPENMKQITDLASQLVNPILPQMEDFIPFELAKKLKEKGFPIKTKTEGKWGLTKVKEVEILPTISQVLKWLREEKGAHITVEISNNGWYYTVYPKVKLKNSKLKIISFDNRESYEQAVIAGIEYVLYNLI